MANLFNINNPNGKMLMSDLVISKNYLNKKEIDCHFTHKLIHIINK